MQRLEQAVAEPKHHQIVLRARLVQGAESQMIHVRLARHQRVDHVAAEAVAEEPALLSEMTPTLQARDRLEPLGRRQPHQHLAVVERRGAFDAKAVAVEQQRRDRRSSRHWQGRAPSAPRPHEISGAIAQDYVLLAKAQMGEKVFEIGDLLEHAEHDDDIGLGCGLESGNRRPRYCKPARRRR